MGLRQRMMGNDTCGSPLAAEGLHMGTHMSTCKCEHTNIHTHTALKSKTKTNKSKYSLTKQSTLLLLPTFPLWLQTKIFCPVL